MYITDSTPLAALTTLRLGGRARRLVEVETAEELVAAVRATDDQREPLLLLGGGSNLVPPDAGFDGTVVVIRTRGVQEHPCPDDPRAVQLTVQAGEPWDELVERTVTGGLAGLECLSGIPGLTGATPVQNVGAYGQEVAQAVTLVRAYDRQRHEVQELGPADCAFGYRTSRFKRDLDRWVVLDVTFRLQAQPHSEPIRYAELARTLGVEVGSSAPLSAVREAVLGLRRSKGMVLDPDDPDSISAGSFFTNPVLSEADYRALRDRTGGDVPCFAEPDGRVKVPAAWLIGQAGFGKGYGEGPVRLSTKHTLALTNRGGGTTDDLLRLARHIRDEVRSRTGVELVNEPVLVGEQL